MDIARHQDGEPMGSGPTLYTACFQENLTATFFTGMLMDQTRPDKLRKKEALKSLVESNSGQVTIFWWGLQGKLMP